MGPSALPSPPLPGRLALTTAVNPLLRPLAEAGGLVLERWADEEAATHIGNRTVVAHAVGRAALASAGASRPAALAASVAGALLLTLCCAVLANAASDSESLAESAARAGSAPAVAGRLVRAPWRRRTRKAP